MEKPGLSLKPINILESYGSVGYYQILLILFIGEVLDTFKRVSWTWIPDVLNQSSFKPIPIAETFKQLLGPQNYRKFNCYYSFIYIYGEKNVHKSPKTFEKIL